jgi:hypothetical protein
MWREVWAFLTREQINAILYYLSTLMNQIGFDRKTSVFMSLVGGGSLLLGTIPGVLYMEKFGRRFWYVSSKASASPTIY